MEEWFSRFFQNFQLQLGLRDPKLTAPEKNLSGIFLETDTGENIDILLVGKDGRVEELRGRTPAEELVRFASLDFAEYHAVIQRLWTEHPLFWERMDVPYREAHGKKPFDDDNDPPASPWKHKDNTSKKKLARRKKQGFRTVTKSVTDPDCGLFVKGEHKRQFAYEAHTACDKNGFVLETVVTPGNVHDSVAFDEVYDKVTENFPQVEAVVADAAYKTPHICKKVLGDGRVLSTAYKRPQTMKNGHEWWKYVYDEFYDCVICPEYQPLKYSTTNRDGYREYKSDPNICAACPTRERCTHSRDCIKTVQRHIWKDYEELADDARYTPAYAQLYKCRKETIERVFADAKEKHAMRYTQYRGLAQVTNWVKLKFVAMNLKKLATWKWRNLLSSFRFAVFSLIYVRDPVCS